VKDSKKPMASSLGTGMAASAAKKLSGRARSIDDAVDAATGGSPGQADRAAFNWDKSVTDKKSGRYSK
jgi:hypothetical protein